MRFSLATLALLVSASLAAPTSLKTVEKATGPKKEGSYIVTLGDGVSKGKHIDALRKLLGAEESITHDDWDSKVLNGFSAQLSSKVVDFLRAHPDVARIEEDQIFSITATQVRSALQIYEAYSRSPSRPTRRGASSASARGLSLRAPPLLR